MYASKVKATGYYVPEFVVRNDDLAAIVDTSDAWIRPRTGIGERRIAMEENTSDLAAKAAVHILENAGIAAEQVELIIVATISGDYAMPSTACLVQQKLGAVNATAFDITAACSGFIFALSTADKFIRSGSYRNALVLGADVLSKTIDWTDRTTCVLFGDGAGGIYLEQSEEQEGSILAECLGSDGTGGMALTSGEFPTANVFNGKVQGLPSPMFMDGREIFKFATKKIPVNIEELLSAADMKKEEITYVVLHQANERIIQAVAKKLDMPLEKFYRNMFYYGNTSSASIPIALAEMEEKHLLKKGDNVVLAGFGGGLTWGSMAVRF